MVLSTRPMTDVSLYLTLAWICLLGVPVPASANPFDWIPAPVTCVSSNAPALTQDQKPLPAWPGAYSMQVEANMKQGGWSYDAEEQVDVDGKMAYVRTTVFGETQQTIFNTENLERHKIIGGDSCTTDRGGRDFHPLVLASMTQASVDSTKVSFSHVVLDLAGFLYVGQTTVRGILANHWTSCQEWSDMSAKLQIDVYFSLPEYKSSWSQGEIPIRAEVKGNTGLFNSQDIPKSFQFENVYDFKSFKSGPSFKPDPTMFEIPTRVVCVGGTNNKALPDLPDSFEMDIELNAPHLGSSVPLVTSVRYDWEHQIVESVREFAVPLGGNNKARYRPKSFYTNKNRKQEQTEWIVVKTVTTVDDYNTGIQYITEKANNTCMMRHLPDSNSMSHGNMIMRLYKDQKHGLSDLEYQGRTSLRGVPAEAWGMDKDGLVLKVFFLSRAKGAQDVVEDTSDMTEEERKTFEVGIAKLQFNFRNTFPVLLGMVVRNRTTAGERNFPQLIQDLMDGGVFAWYGDALKRVHDKDSDSLVTDDLVYRYLSWNRMNEMQSEAVGEVDVFVHHFQPLHTSGDVFHVSQCYQSDQIANVVLTVKASFEENVRVNPSMFLNALRSAISRVTGITTLQIGDMQATPLVDSEKNIDVTLVTFNLLGLPTLEGSKRDQQDLGTSKKNIIKSIISGITFKVKYPLEFRSFSVEKNLFDYSLSKSPVVTASRTGGNSDNHDGGKKYSAGVVAGVAIAVFLVSCCIFGGIYFLTYKTRRPASTPSVPYHIVTED